MPGQTQISKSQIEKKLIKQVKKVVSNRGINVATRKGTKELNILAKNICCKHKNLEELEKIGTELGEKIIAASEQRNKKFLDRGVVRLTAGSSYVKSLLGITPKQKQVDNSNETAPTTEASMATEESTATEESMATEESTATVAAPEGEQPETEQEQNQE